MSLVDYASSDEEEDDKQQQQPCSPKDDTHHHHHQPSSSSPSLSPPPPLPHSLSLADLPDQKSKDALPVLPPPTEKLPDASFLLSSPILSQTVGSDHSSRVAAAMAENATRKREANGLSSSYIRGKIPRGNLPHSKGIPDTSSGLLLPPQITGRSNVVTEDIGKLFVKKNSQGK